MSNRELLLDLSYDDLIKYSSYGDRLNYLSLYKKGYISPRTISNKFYRSRLWIDLRDQVIARDLGYDLGVPGMEIEGPILVHHIFPLEEEDILNWDEDVLLNPNRLITTSIKTHNIIHYGDRSQSVYVERKPGDTKLW